MSHLIINGKHITASFPVDHSLYNQFTNIKKQTLPILGGVLHHDVTFNPGQTHRVLKQRGLSSHFTVDDDGTVFQFLDPALHRAVHCRNFNTSYIGIDINNPCLIDRMDKEDLPDGLARPLCGCFVNGHEVELLGYTEPQINSTSYLVHVLSDSLIIPKVIPRDLNYHPEIDRTYRGWLYHLHVDPRKIDPCTFPVHRLNLQYWKPE